MIKSELIAKLAADNPHLFQRDVERIVNTIFDEMTAALARGGRVELRGFGAFSVKHRPARMGGTPGVGAAAAPRPPRAAHGQPKPAQGQNARRGLARPAQARHPRPGSWPGRHMPEQECSLCGERSGRCRRPTGRSRGHRV